MLLVAVRTAVTLWQPCALRDDNVGAHLTQERAAPLSFSRTATQPGFPSCCWCRVVVCVVGALPSVGTGDWPGLPVVPRCFD